MDGFIQRCLRPSRVGLIDALSDIITNHRCGWRAAGEMRNCCTDKMMANCLGRPFWLSAPKEYPDSLKTVFYSFRTYALEWPQSNSPFSTESSGNVAFRAVWRSVQEIQRVSRSLCPGIVDAGGAVSAPWRCNGTKWLSGAVGCYC